MEHEARAVVEKINDIGMQVVGSTFLVLSVEPASGGCWIVLDGTAIWSSEDDEREHVGVCPACRGTGQVMEEVHGQCLSCGGAGTDIDQYESLEVYVRRALRKRAEELLAVAMAEKIDSGEVAACAEGDIPEPAPGLQMPREELLEAALADAYRRIEALLEEREPVLRKANELILSAEKRETIGADWHPFFDQWLRTFVEWARRRGGEGAAQMITTVHMVRDLFAKLSGFKPQQTPEPTLDHGRMSLARRYAPVPDQERPTTSEIMPPDGDSNWGTAGSGPPSRPVEPRMVRDKSVTHEVVTRFNLETGYVEWRGYRIVDGEPALPEKVI